MKKASKEDGPIKVLQILPGGHVCGGIENFVMNYYRNIDKTKVQFDFLVHYNEKGYYDDEIKKLGGHIYYTNVRCDKKIFKYFRYLNSFFKEHKEYKIIHGHMPGLAPIYFFVAKLRGVKCRISHSHVTNTERTLKGRILKIVIKNIRFFSNKYFACSIAAGKFMYGKRNFTVINNAIDVNKFKFNSQKRDELRKEYKVDDKFVIGCVGRFNQQKNHKFLIEIFNSVLKIKNNATLLLIGEGELEEQIKLQAKELGILDKIQFLGIKSDIYNYYNMFDVFVLPSNFEGLGIVLIESQVNGIKTITSDVVPREACVSDLIDFIPLTTSPEEWAKIIVKNVDRKDRIKEIEKVGYSLKIEAVKLQNRYLDMYKELEK